MISTPNEVFTDRTIESMSQICNLPKETINQILDLMIYVILDDVTKQGIDNPEGNLEIHIPKLCSFELKPRSSASNTILSCYLTKPFDKSIKKALAGESKLCDIAVNNLSELIKDKYINLVKDDERYE